MDEEFKLRLTAEKEREDREMDEYTAVVDKEGALEKAHRMDEVLRAVDDEVGNSGAGAAETEPEKQEMDANEDEEDEQEEEEEEGAGVDEAARRALLRAAQLRATGVEPQSRNDRVRSSNEDRGRDTTNETLDALAELAREYFSVDFIEDDSGRKEMVVMTSPEFIGFLLVAVILSGRLGHFIVTTYLMTPVDPLLR